MAIEIKPDFYYSVQKLGHMYVYKGEYERAAEYYSMLSGSSSQEWRASGRECIALIFMHQGKFAKALEVIDAAITADRMEQAGKTTHPEKFFQKTRIFMEKNDMDRAINEFEAGMKVARETNPEAETAYNDMYVYLLLLAGRTDEANAVFEKLEKDLKDKGGLYEISALIASALREYGSGNAEAAAELLTEAFDRWPSPRATADFGSRYLLGMTLLDAGRLSEAVREFEGILTVYSEKRAVLPTWSVKCHYHLAKAVRAGRVGTTRPSSSTKPSSTSGVSRTPALRSWKRPGSASQTSNGHPKRSNNQP